MPAQSPFRIRSEWVWLVVWVVPGSATGAAFTGCAHPMQEHTVSEPTSRPADASALEQVAARYLEQTKGWKRDEFRTEFMGLDPASGHAIIRGIFLEDERRPMPGGGQSVELYLDRGSQRVARELHFQ